MVTRGPRRIVGHYANAKPLVEDSGRTTPPQTAFTRAPTLTNRLRLVNRPDLVNANQAAEPHDSHKHPCPMSAVARLRRPQRLLLTASPTNQATARNDNLSPSAPQTLSTVDQVGFPWSDNAL